MTAEAKQSNQFTPVIDRFNAGYIPEPNSGCWIWTGASSPTSYPKDVRPRINVNGRPVAAYRLSYELFVGRIPSGLMICHKCNVPLCVNPDHLYAGTAKDNALDSIKAGMPISGPYLGMIDADLVWGCMLDHSPLGEKAE